MRFSKERPVKIVMLGCGGTGGYIAPHLYRLLHTINRNVQFIVADGDSVEEKNLVRQNFIHGDLGQNKAKVLAQRYSSVFGIKTQYIPEFIEDEEQLIQLVTPEQFSMGGWSDRVIVDELVILIGAVDNNKSRKLCDNVFRKVSPLIYIDSGNGEYTGQIVCGIRNKNKTIYKPMGSTYPDVLNDNDKFPTELSCVEASISAPQSIVANIMASTIVVNYVYNILVIGEIRVRSVGFSTNTIHMQPNRVKSRKLS